MLFISAERLSREENICGARLTTRYLALPSLFLLTCLMTSCTCDYCNVCQRPVVKP